MQTIDKYYSQEQRAHLGVGVLEDVVCAIVPDAGSGCGLYEADSQGGEDPGTHGTQ